MLAICEVNNCEIAANWQVMTPRKIFQHDFLKGRDFQMFLQIKCITGITEMVLNHRNKKQVVSAIVQVNPNEALAKLRKQRVIHSRSSSTEIPNFIQHIYPNKPQLPACASGDLLAYASMRGYSPTTAY